MRIIFVKSREAKERLKPALDAGNVDKTMKAPVTAIIGMDIHFYEKLPQPVSAGREVVVQGPAGERAGVHRDCGTLRCRATYFMLAARALGLDCGPMSGFDNFEEACKLV